MIGGYVYVMKGVFLRSKIGITKYPYRRQQNVDKTTKGNIKIVVCYRFVFPRFVERSLHLVFAVFRTRVKGSGGTEYFWLPYPITAFVLTVVWFFSALVSVFIFLFAILIYQNNGNMDSILIKLSDMVAIIKTEL